MNWLRQHVTEISVLALVLALGALSLNLLKIWPAAEWWIVPLGEFFSIAFSGLVAVATISLVVATVGLLKVNRKMVNLQDTFQRFEMNQRNPKLLGGGAELLRYPSSAAFVVELKCENPGAVPIYLEEAIVTLEGLDIVRYDYTKMRDECKLIMAPIPKKISITVETPKAKDELFWPRRCWITLTYISGLGTKQWHQAYEVHPGKPGRAFLFPYVEE